MPRYKVEVTLYTTIEDHDADYAHERFMQRHDIGMRLLKAQGAEISTAKVTLLDEPEPDCEDEIEANEVEEDYQLEADMMIPQEEN